MAAAEQDLFVHILKRSVNYLEFGAGGSTCVASGLVGGRIVTVDSSAEWLDRVVRWCADKGTVKPRAVFADIGPVSDWGRPADVTSRAKWPRYHAAVWEIEDGRAFDTFMIDGRFRVACFMQVLLNCRADVTILMHDFAKRPHYHVVREVADEVDAVKNLAVFRPRADGDRTRIEKLLAEFAYDPG